MKHSRFVVGIDLGTTNCAVSYIDTAEDVTNVPNARLFAIPQLTDAGVVEPGDLLPSFLYLPGPSELPENSLSLPWKAGMSYAVGEFARKRGAEVPVRLVSSAKSWLCHQHLDKTSPLLPWNAPEEVRKLSPVDVTSSFLLHLRMAWNHLVAAESAEYALENQDVLITVPASFDAAARDLTVRAAEGAGLGDITLLEEPQAAFYSWINRSGDAWRKQVKVGDVILVCDIGGGTTDFSLIEVTDEGGDMALKRVAVGEHILLGGDNMDLALAYSVKRQFTEKKIALDTRQMLGLLHQSRNAKEMMLNDPGRKTEQIVVLGSGRSVIGGALQTELHRSEVEEIILDGFFPRCAVSDEPSERRGAGFRELGLHYATDTAVTKYLAKFLRQHLGMSGGRPAGGVTFVHPTKMLFNGGVTKASVIRQRCVEALNGWLSSEGGGPLSVLEGNDPDLAVAIGAAYYGFAKRGKGVRIRAGAGRSYYIGVESAMPAVPGMSPPLKAVCVVPFGMEEGTDHEIPGHEFGLVVGEQAVFRFLSSVTRKADLPGSVVEEWEVEEIVEAAPLDTTLPADEGERGAVVPVRLHSYLTETGTLELWCEAVDGRNRWKLEYNVREEGSA
ncbi:MAG: Hsp70 family protein [Chloroflexota bacterium]